jgi:putative transposase
LPKTNIVAGYIFAEPINRRQYRTRAEARTDIFDYIERFHNPRKRRQLEMRQQQDLGLTKPSVEMG